MMVEPTIKFTFGLNDPELEDNRRQEIAIKLLGEIRNLDEVERADRSEDLNPEALAKAGLTTLIGFLTAEVSIKNIKYFLGFLGDRLGDKPIKIHVKVGDKETTIEANSRQELLESERIVNNLLESMGGKDNA